MSFMNFSQSSRTLYLSSLMLSCLMLFSGLLSGCDTSQQDTSASSSPTTQSHATAADPDSGPSERNTQPVDVLIVGGGLSGLSTAYHLQKAGISYRVLELAPRVGGRVRTGRYPEGSRAEVGLAEFWDGNPALDIAKELGVKTERVDTGLSSYMHDGKLEPFLQSSNQEFVKAILGAADYAKYQAWDKKMQEMEHALASGPPSAEMMKLKDISFGDWLKKQGLSANALSLVRAILDPEIGTSIDRIGALDGIAEWHIFAGAGANPNHMVGGNENLPKAIAKKIGLENISLNTQVTNVIDGPEGVEIRAVDTSSYRNYTYKAKYAVMAIPLFRLNELQFEPRLNQKVYDAISSQLWGSYFTAHVMLDKAAEKFWTVKGKNVLPILTGGPLGVIYPDMESAGPNLVMLNLLVTGDFAEADNSRLMSLDDVQKQLEDAFEKLYPGSKAMIRKWSFYRYHPRAIASWPVGRSRFDELSNGLRKAHGHLYFGGDFTESSHSDGAIISALRVSAQIKQAMGKK